MRVANQKPDFITVVSLLQACASIGAYHQGKWIHNYVLRSCIAPCIRLGTALVDMYAKCGDLVSARKVFDRMPEHDSVSWSAIIAGYGSNGKGDAALEMYTQFLQSGLPPNDVVFLSILYACSHNGLVGITLFESMVHDYKIEPKIEHNAFVVDLLCRAGRVQEAYEFYRKMFAEPMGTFWVFYSMLVEKTWHEEVGCFIAKEICECGPADGGRYVQIAHSFASMERWDSVGEAWARMRGRGLKKIPGWSYVEMQGEITPFFTSHSSHPQYQDIVSVLRNLSDNTKKPVLNWGEEDACFDFDEAVS